MSDFELKFANIRMPGAWNTRLFSPEWLIKTLNLEENSRFDKRIGLGVNFEERDFSFEFCGISLQPTRTILTIQLTRLDNIFDSLTFSVKVLKTIIATLCHTPIKAIGFNLVYEFPVNTNCKIANMLLKKEDVSDFTVKQKTLSKDANGYSVNIVSSVNQEQNSILGKFEFNFHYSKFDQLSDDIFVKHLNYANEVLNG
jgi:hypothetical protein